VKSFSANAIDNPGICTLSAYNSAKTNWSVEHDENSHFYQLSTFWHRLGILVSRALDPSVEGWCFESRSGRVKDWKIGTCYFPGYRTPLTWDLEQGWLAQCQFKVTRWGIMFISGMVLRCTVTLKAGLSLGQQNWQRLSYIAINCW